MLDQKKKINQEIRFKYGDIYFRRIRKKMFDVETIIIPHRPFDKDVEMGTDFDR